MNQLQWTSKELNLEEEYSRLTADFDFNRKEAENKAKDMSVDEYNTFRFLAKTDLFFLATGILGFDRLSPNLHGNLAGWMYDTNGVAQFREILLPRGHFKSTIATITDSIQIVLPDDCTNFNSPYPRNLGTDCRLVIGHEGLETAKRFLYAITANFLSNPLLMALFPEAIPNPKRHKINLSELELPRKSRWPEPTIDTMSTGARGQGRHYNYLKLDDLIGDKARDSEIEMRAAIEWFDNIQSFFSNFKLDKFDIIGTRWAMNDLYHHAHRVYGDLLYKYIRPVIEVNPETGKKEPIFPEEFTEQQLSILRKNPRVWTAQYLNDPTAGAQEFLPEWKRFWVYGKSPKEVVLLEPDLASRFSDDSGYGLVGNSNSPAYNNLYVPSHAPPIVQLEELDIAFLIDPAMSGESGFIVAGKDKFQRIIVLEAIKEALKTPEFVELFFEKLRAWWPRVASIESVLFSGLYAHYLPSEMMRRGLKVPIHEYKVGTKEKDARVLALSPKFKNGQIYFNQNQTSLIEEYDYFGTAAKYHLLDALAQESEVLLPGRIKVGGRDDKKRDEVLKGRSNLTGYSRLY